jgi:hypothetical protein
VDTSAGGECSIDSTYHVDMPKSTIASRDGIGLRTQWVEPHEGFRRVRGCTRKSIAIDALAGAAAVGVSRVGAERERDIISVTSSAQPFAPIVRSPKTKSWRAQTRMKSVNGRLLVDSPREWDHNLGLRAQSRPLRMTPTLRTLATALCLLGLVATGIVGGSGLGPTTAQARPTPP